MSVDPTANPAAGVKAYIEAYPTDDNCDGPAYAEMLVTREFVEALRLLSSLCVDHDLSEARRYMGPDDWESAEEYRLTCEELVVAGDRFWFHAYPKHASHGVETRSQMIDAFVRAVDEAPPGGSIFLGDDAEALENLILENAV